MCVYMKVNIIKADSENVKHCIITNDNIIDKENLIKN